MQHGRRGYSSSFLEASCPLFISTRQRAPSPHLSLSLSLVSLGRRGRVQRGRREKERGVRAALRGRRRGGAARREELIKGVASWAAEGGGGAARSLEGVEATTGRGGGGVRQRKEGGWRRPGVHGDGDQTKMQNNEDLLPRVVQPQRPRDQEPNPESESEPNPQSERGNAFGKDVVLITGSTIMTGFSGYKDITNTSRLFKISGVCLLLTFTSAVLLTNFHLHVPPGSWCSRCTSAVLVPLTSILLMATNTMFVALANKDDTLLVILVLPVVLVLGTLSGADVLPDEQVGQAYDDCMKSNSELASFGATAAFAVEGIIILAYLKYPSFGGGGHSQIDLAVSYFAAMISVLAMTVTALPVGSLSPSARARLVAVVGHLRCAMLAALISMAMIIAVEFLEWWFMLSLLPEVIVGTLNVAMMSCREAPGLDGEDVGDGGAAEREKMVKRFKAVATMSFTLMAGTYAVYLGHNSYDVYLRAAMLVMLAAIVSSLRKILRPFDLDLPRAGAWWAPAIGAVSLLFPGLALVIAGPLLVKLFVQLCISNSRRVS